MTHNNNEEIILILKEQKHELLKLKDEDPAEIERLLWQIGEQIDALRSTSTWGTPPAIDNNTHYL